MNANHTSSPQYILPTGLCTDLYVPRFRITQISFSKHFEETLLKKLNSEPCQKIIIDQYLNDLWLPTELISRLLGHLALYAMALAIVVAVGRV